MKTVSGSVISSKPISLSKSASVLTSFISVETGASESVSTYLRRASASFNELVQFHRELKSGKSVFKRKKIPTEAMDIGNLTKADRNPREYGPSIERGRILDFGEEEGFMSRENYEGGDLDDEGRNSGRNKNKKNKRRNVEIEEEKSEERRKKKEVNIEVEGFGVAAI